jgi:hypothetical protein
MTDHERALAAATSLRARLGRPPWLSAIGVGALDGRPALVLYLTSDWRPRLPFLDGGWEGYPVLFREFGSVAPLGGPLP